MPRLLFIWQNEQIRHDVLHLRGAEFICWHDAASRQSLWIAKMLLDPDLPAPALQTVQWRAEFAADPIRDVTGATLILLIDKGAGDCEFRSRLQRLGIARIQL